MIRKAFEESTLRSTNPATNRSDSLPPRGTWRSDPQRSTLNRRSSAAPSSGSGRSFGAVPGEEVLRDSERVAVQKGAWCVVLSEEDSDWCVDVRCFLCSGDILKHIETI